MKTLLSVLALLLCISLSAQIAEAPTQGTGTADNPFQIASFANLFWLTQTPGVWSMYFIQTADIDASDSALISDPTPNTSGWIPIGSTSPYFTGFYDGQGYKIFDLYMHRPSLNYAGLFGYMQTGTLNRINLRDVNILGNTYVGGLAAVANYGSVVNNCSVTGSVNGVTNVGGLLGYCDGSGSTNSYTYASVYASGDNVGGFVGLSGWNNGTYHNFCYSTGSVTSSSSYKGGFIGRTGSVTLRDCYWDLQTSGMATDPLAVGKTTAELKQQATYYRWNFHNQWSIEEGVSYPDLDALLYNNTPPALSLDDLLGSGTSDSPYLLMNAAQLNVMRQDLSAHYALGADIDLSASVAWNHGRGWEPVGNNSSRFTGTFDGNGYTISGLCISRPKTDFQGLFGYASGATIRRTNLDNVHILGQTYCGGVSGYAEDSSIDEINFQGTIIAYSFSGGIAGVVKNGSVQRCWADVDMMSFNAYAGGITGNIASSTSISGVVSNSGSTGAIEGSNNVGGVVGMISWGYVLNSYSHASISGSYQAGGLVGTNGWDYPGHISRCFATGLVTLKTGGSLAGGLVGYFVNGSVLESYWDTQSSGMPTSSGTGATGKTTTQMMQQSTFERWNFDTLWQMGTRGYPAHKDLSIHALPVALTPADLLGSGLPDQPYVIQSIDELNVMRQAPGASYYLNNDIDLSATCVWNGGRGWTPVGTSTIPFTGRFDGGGHELSHLFIELPGGVYVGLIGYASGSTIRDASFTDVSLHARSSLGTAAGQAYDSRIDLVSIQGTISGLNSVGGIAGQIVRSIIQRSQADVTAWASGDYAGGIVGSVSSDASFNSTVSTCESSGMVRASSNAGGLIGSLGYGSLINSASHAAVLGYSQIGGAVGLCGWNDPGSVVRCYSTGQIITEPGGYHAGGLVGRLQNGQTYNSYWDTQSSGVSSSSGAATGLNTSAMMQRDSYRNWNFDTLWQIFEGTDYPVMRDLSIYQDQVPVALNELLGSGVSGDPYLIQTPSQLSAIRQDLNAHYQIMEDLDLSATLIWNGGRGWIPVGTNSQPFTGTILGAGKNLQNLNIMAPLTDYVGFLGKAQNSTISDLRLKRVSLVGNSNLGGLAGSADLCALSRVVVDGKFNGFNAIGGLIGVTSGGSIQSCSADASIISSGYYLGALIGSVQGDALLSKCSSTGAVEGSFLIGGLAGELLQGSIHDSYSHARVRGDNTLGGAVGRIGWSTAGHLLRCYSTGSVIVNPGGYNYGGLVGQLFNGSITGCYWDMSTSGMATSSGSGSTGLTTALMTYPNSQYYIESWDFTNIWRHDNTSMQNSGYPYLIWQETAIPDAVQNLIILSESGQLTLQWQAVTGVTGYNIYASDDPTAPWTDWTYLGQTSGTNYPVSGGVKRFFIVRSVID